MPGFAGIPFDHDVLLAILLCVEDLSDLLHLTLVCKSLRDTIRSTISIQYKLALLATGRVDFLGNYPLSLRQRLDTLIEQEERWEAPKAKGHYSHEIKNAPLEPPFRTSGHSLVIRTYPGASVARYSLSKIESYKNVPQTEGIYLWDLDEAQDMLVLLIFTPPGQFSDCEIHIRNLSEPTRQHPRAAMPFVLRSLEGERRLPNEMRVLGDLFALESNIRQADASHRREFMIWDWTLGRQLFATTDLPPVRIQMIASDLLMCYNWGTSSLDLYHLDTEASELRHTISFKLPDYNIPSDVQPRGVGLLTRPVPSYPTTIPFDERYRPMRIRPRLKRFEIFFHPHAILREYHQAATSSTSSTSEPKIVPWEDWGPHTTRWFPNDESFRFRAQCQESHRMIVPHQGRLRVLDFAPYPRRPSLRSSVFGGPEPTVPRLVQTGENATVSSVATEWFKGEVRSRLPYRETEVSFEGLPEGFSEAGLKNMTVMTFDLDHILLLDPYNEVHVLQIG